MRKGTGVFKQVEEYIDVCDECGLPVTPFTGIEYDCTWNDGYDHYGDKFDFCSIDCLKLHIKNSGYDEDYFFPHGETVSIDAPSSIMKTILWA